MAVLIKVCKVVLKQNCLGLKTYKLKISKRFYKKWIELWPSDASTLWGCSTIKWGWFSSMLSTLYPSKGWVLQAFL